MIPRSTSFPASVASEVKRPALQWGHWICFAAFVVGLTWVGAKTFMNNSGNAGAPEAALLLAAAATTLVSLSRRLPAQNVLLAAAIVGVIGIIAQACRPFGIPIGLTHRVDPGISFVWLPLVWLIMVFNSRGAARLILSRLRRANHYGYWLLALTTLLAVAFAIGFEMFASAALGWHRIDGNPFHLAGLATTTIAILVLITPALIQKKPVVLPPDYHPLTVWGLLNLLFVGVSAVHRFS